MFALLGFLFWIFQFSLSPDEVHNLGFLKVGLRIETCFFLVSNLVGFVMTFEWLLLKRQW